MSLTVQVKRLGLQAYHPVWQAMRRFVQRKKGAEIWLLEHLPVFTLGQAGKKHHLLNPGNIPIIQTDRGGQVTYHGPGQLIVYLLLNMPSLGMGVRALVTGIENSVIDLLANYGLSAYADPKAPGIYIEQKKIASLGLRIKQGYVYHGLALNLDMDLSPFERINPCGYPDLKMTQLIDYCTYDRIVLEKQLLNHLAHYLKLELN